MREIRGHPKLFHDRAVPWRIFRGNHLVLHLRMFRARMFYRSSSHGTSADVPGTDVPTEFLTRNIRGCSGHGCSDGIPHAEHPRMFRARMFRRVSALGTWHSAEHHVPVNFLVRNTRVSYTEKTMDFWFIMAQIRGKFFLRGERSASRLRHIDIISIYAQAGERGSWNQLV